MYKKFHSKDVDTHDNFVSTDEYQKCMDES